MNIKPISRKQNIVVQEFEKELLVYDLQINKAFCLNETSAIIYQLCDGTKSVAEISQTLYKNLKQSISEDLIWLALDSFKKENLLEEGESFAVNFNGLTRRQVIKKVGFATMIALPVVSSVVAPSATMAASGGLALFAACTTNPDCASGHCNTCNDGLCPVIGAKYCCVGTSSQSPGSLQDGCKPVGGCPIEAGACCSGAIVTGPSNCQLPGREACFCA